jgi:hypothetical protein
MRTVDDRDYCWQIHLVAQLPSVFTIISRSTVTILMYREIYSCTMSK